MKRRASIIPIAAGLVALLVVPLAAGCAAPSSAKTGTPGPEETAAAFSLTVTQPLDNTVTSERTVQVKGRTRPQAVVSVSNEIVVAGADGNFAATITLDDGVNIIEVLASDEAGNQASVTLVVTLVRGG